ncbi:MAG: ABC transporter permease [Acidobacteria bacterium]|nr:ABC transporter permease [Acidobacteriota bacterium]
MSPAEIVRDALGEIAGHKLRSALTLLGIVLGTLSITVMTSFLDGVIASVWDGFSDLGYDGVMYVVARPPKTPREAALFARSRGLQPRDAELVLARRREVTAVAPVALDRLLVRRGGLEREVQVFGVTAAFGEVRNRRVAEGRFVEPADEDTFARVAVLGHRLKRRLFGAEPALGRSITVGSRTLRVVGVVEPLGNQFVNDRDFVEEMEGLYLPLATLRKLFTGEEQPLAYLAVKTGAAGRLEEVRAEIDAALTIAHRGATDFRVANIAEEMLRIRKEIEDVLRNWRIVIGAIAGISLLVGGIGLLSVMLISIRERFFEIGLRKACGATDGQIFVQFLAESVALAALGGVLGIGFGVALTKSFAGYFKAGLPIHVEGLALAMLVAVAVGAVYGTWPALLASRMPPVDALRSAA